MRHLLLIAIVCGILSGCGKDDNNPSSASSRLTYNLTGGPCGGDFLIEEDDDPNTIEATAALFPATADNPEIAIITFSNQATSRSVSFQLPAMTTGSPIQIMEDDEFFGMIIQHHADDCILTHGVLNTNMGLTVDVKKFKKESGPLSTFLVGEMEATFSGVLSHTDQMGQNVEYTISGEFYFDGIF